MSLVATILLFQALGASPPDSLLVVRAGHLLNPADGQVVDDVALVIRDGRIAQRIDGAGSWRSPPGGREVDLRAYTVLPGLIDTHVHLTLRGVPEDNARKTLLAGFTTVADLGSIGHAGPALRDAIEAGNAVGPRIVAAGSWIGGKGGVCEFGGATIRGAAEAEARARGDVAAGANLLKVCLTTWLPGVVASPDSIELTEAELTAVMAVGAEARLPVVAHAIGQGGVEAALRQGVRWLVHLPVVDSATAVELSQRGICVGTTTTTLLRGDATGALRSSFQRLRAAGVRLAMGTDTPLLPHGENARELESLVSLGLTPLEAIQAATTVAAGCLALDPEDLRLNVGARADLIAVAGDPRRDVTVFRSPVAVIKAGTVVTP